MTMSVGLGRIENDSQATVLTRKALGILSTPGLLVYDDALTIDETGRITLRLKDGGGLQKDETGLSLVQTFGIDSEVNLNVGDHDREWNARLTGSAPNYFEGSLNVGTESVPLTKMHIMAQYPQQRLSFDDFNTMVQYTWPNGFHEFYSVGTRPGFQFISGYLLPDNLTSADISQLAGGVRINFGTEVERILRYNVDMGFAGGGTIGSVSWEELLINVDPAWNVQPSKDHVTACPTVAIPSQILCWSARVSAVNQIAVRVGYFDVVGARSEPWIILLHQLEPQS